jgi:hypothetical protein
MSVATKQRGANLNGLEKLKGLPTLGSIRCKELDAKSCPCPRCYESREPSSRKAFQFVAMATV